MIQEGDRLPPFRLLDDAGQVVTDADLATGTVVLYFYPRDDTPGCTREACDFRDGLADFRARGVRVFGVSADDVASHVAFRDKHALTFPLLADEGHALCDALGLWGEQVVQGYRFTGIARTTLILREGTVHRVFADVSVVGHADAVLAAC
ncbi:MAG: peroxiredoxin [Myxococcales bacterium]|nr:peroxiredoxin [Myxococcales bacterium]MCB9547480.1 peroxiredoxin [Myxococcales bacterium]